MKISNKLHIPLNKINSTLNKIDKVKSHLATGTGIDIRLKKAPNNIIKKNTPDDPIVAKKILDSLSLGLISFNQDERDTLANILMDKAKSLLIK